MKITVIKIKNSIGVLLSLLDMTEDRMTNLDYKAEVVGSNRAQRNRGSIKAVERQKIFVSYNIYPNQNSTKKYQRNRREIILEGKCLRNSRIPDDMNPKTYEAKQIPILTVEHQ